MSASLGGRVSAENLRDYVLARMRDRGIPSQAQLAIRAEVNPNTLSNWFQGKTSPSAYQLDRIARTLGVGVNDLWAAYGGSPTPQSEAEEAQAGEVQAAYERGFRDGWRAAIEQHAGA